MDKLHLVKQIDAIKTKITDQEYWEIMDLLLNVFKQLDEKSTQHTNRMKDIQLYNNDWLPRELNLRLMVNEDIIYLEDFGVIPMTPAEYEKELTEGNLDQTQESLTLLIKAVIYDFNQLPEIQREGVELYIMPCDYFTVGVKVTGYGDTSDLKDTVTRLFYDNCKSFIGRGP